MSSLVEIANAALDLVGQQQIMTLDDQTAAARKAKLHIYDAIREVLGVGRWTSAQKASELARIAEAPDFGWDYKYQLPGDYISTVSVNENDADSPRPDLWEIRGRELFTDETEINLVYVADLTATGNDINAASPLLTECFKLKLATKLAWVFQQSRSLRESLIMEYEQKRNRALARDAREHRKPIVTQLNRSSWVTDRLHSTND